LLKQAEIAPIATRPMFIRTIRGFQPMPN